MDLAAHVAEFVGMFVFALAVFATDHRSGRHASAIWVVPLGFAASYLGSTHFNGGHFNLGITVASFFQGDIGWRELLLRTLSDCAAAIAALIVALWLRRP